MKNIDGYLTVHELSSRASMSVQTIRKLLPMIPHHRLSRRGKIWVRWSDFLAFMEKTRSSITSDDDAMEILRGLGRAS